MNKRKLNKEEKIEKIFYLEEFLQENVNNIFENNSTWIINH